MICDNHPTGGKNDSRSAIFKQAMSRLPYVTAETDGIGGVIKAEPEHFEVEEQLPYAPCGEGPHCYITLKRTGWNTVDVADALARSLALNPQDVGWGGRKDKQAVATQTFSVAVPAAVDEEMIKTRLASLPFEILNLRRHHNKIKTGHVAANRFRILLSGVAPDAIGQARGIAQIIQRRGVPNFYGPQRFGIAMGNIDHAVALLARPKTARGTSGAFMVSVLQSALFNQWLSERMQRGAFNTILKGDLVRKTDTGGMFVVDDLADALERWARGAINYTGPIYGHKMMAAKDEAGGWEVDLLNRYELIPSDFKALRAQGSRRAARLDLSDLTVDSTDQGLIFSFTLSSGAYATTVMREFMRQADDGGTN